MAIQNQITAEVVACRESTFGTAPATGSVTARKLRRVSTSLALGKDIFQSAEARPDQQIADLRHGTKRPGGGLECELTNVAYDEFFESLLRGAWAAGTTVLAATYTTIAAAITSGNAGEKGSTGTLTWAGGDPIAAGLRIGDIVMLTGAGFAANENKNFRILSMTGTNNRTIAVTPAPTALAAQAGTNIAVRGRKLLVGVQQHSYSIEQLFGDVDISEFYTGMRVGSGAIRIPPNGMSTVSFGFMGQDMDVLETSASPYFTAPVAIGTDGIFAGPQGSIRVNGAEQGVVTGLDINIDLGLSADPVVGRDTVPNIFYGPTVITGNVSVYLETASNLNAYVNETEIDITSMVTSGAEPANFLCFNMQRVKLSGATKTVGGQGGVVATHPFQALLQGTNALGKDLSSLVIQRSNS